MNSVAADDRRFVAGDDGQRLDLFVRSRCPDLSRSRCAALIKDGFVTVNQAPSKPSAVVRAGDVVAVRVPPPRPIDLLPQDIPLRVLHQDTHLLVVDKPAGLTVHPAPGNEDGTLVNAVLALVPDLEGVGGEHRPGIVHRLDKDTSGVMAIAKTDAAHASLSRQWKDRRVEKRYLALVRGVVRRDQGEIDAPIARNPGNRQKMAVVEGGRAALTRFRVVERFKAHTLIEADLLTGRTHQVRVHLAAIGHPLVGDTTYGKASPLIGRQALHAWKLGLWLPLDERVWREFEASMPDDLLRALEILRRGASAP
ncbi:MAG: RluA family pseudouridine synthase [SAR202 cluster bacterium]|nr:RluA family pseudouridine synthase [SAR202 cluster bacterium]